jgi:predicted PolB exonuclease-like 3'-5' exonuclease
MKTAIVWDIETVPDLEGYARAHKLDGPTDDQIRAAMGSKFPKPIYHSIVCIGAVIAEYADSHWQVRSISAPHVGTQNERELISSFLDQIDKYKPKLVTYNGSGFDLPVLRYRAMLHKLSAPGLFERSYFNRYSNDALDLCDALSSFGSSTKVKLDEICRIMGLDGKPCEIDGSQVSEYYRAGRIQEIADYCVADVINTYRLWLRHELFKGKLDEGSFTKSEKSIPNNAT